MKPTGTKVGTIKPTVVTSSTNQVTKVKVVERITKIKEWNIKIN